MPLAYERPRQSRGILGYVPPSQGDGPYGGQPLSRQGGQLTDYGAGQMNRASRDYLGQNYMPRTTVGGAYGQSPDMDYAASQGYAAGQHNRAFGSAAAQNRMVAQASGRGILGAVNHSSYGATSGTVIDSTGRPRPGWVDNYSGSTGEVGQDDVRRGLDAVYNQGGRVIGPNGRMSLSPGSEQYDATQRAGETFDARRGGLQARIDAYEARTAEAKQFREGNRVARGMQRGQRLTDSLDMRRGNLSMEERFMFGNPQAYARTVEAKNLGAYQQGLLGVQDRATQARERMAGIESGDRRYGIDATSEARKGDREAAGLLAAGQQASNERVAGIQGTNAATVAGVQGQNAVAVANAQRDPNSQAKFNITTMAQLAEVAKTNPALAQEMARQAGLLGGAGAPQGQAGQSGGLLTALNPPKGFAGGLLSEQQHADLQPYMNDPHALVSKMRTYGLKDNEINLALNKLFNPDTMFPWKRSTENPAGNWMSAAGFVNPMTGQRGWNPGTQSQGYQY
jgi:hypothetical protein